MNDIVSLPSKRNARATVRFVGAVQFSSGKWLGVEVMEEGIGKNDGSVQGNNLKCFFFLYYFLLFFIFFLFSFFFVI